MSSVVMFKTEEWQRVEEDFRRLRDRIATITAEIENTEKENAKYHVKIEEYASTFETLEEEKSRLLQELINMGKKVS